ncbi:MAG: rhodanese-like domain-containing protein [Pseudomonadota bacterium]
MPGARVDELTPTEAWELLKTRPDAVLVDVRTRAEWSFVGVPDLSPIGKQTILAEWRSFPGMAPNAEFGATVDAALGGTVPADIFFICRSGARSMEAARETAARLGAAGEGVTCHNVAEGFEGDLDADGHRGAANGWKAHGLPWRQS